jgi:tetratricopeptide (TPR) repeat protein
MHHESPDAIDLAIHHLQAALRFQPESARLLNDLAASYFVRAAKNRRPTDLILALDYLDRALAREPGLAEARFNRGLVFERLGFCAPAEAAWRDYLAADRQSDWAREAWSRRTALPCTWPDWPPVAAWAAGTEKAPPEALESLLILSPTDVLRRALADLLPAWAEAYLAGDRPQASRRLSRLRSLGEELRARTRDETILRSIRKIDDAGPAVRRRLALAHRRFGEAANLQAASLYTRAQQRYRRAAQWGGNFDVPVVLWAHYGVLSTLLQEGNYSQARKVVRKLRASPHLTVLPALAAKVSWSEGLAQLRTGSFAESRQSFEASATLYNGLADPIQRGAARALAAESLSCPWSRR